MSGIGWVILRLAALFLWLRSLLRQDHFLIVAEALADDGDGRRCRYVGLPRGHCRSRSAERGDV